MNKWMMVIGITVAGIAVYLIVYYTLRSNHYMIHRSNSHDEHWITLGNYNTSIHLFASDPSASADREEGMRRFVFTMFWPARKLEEFYQNHL